MVWGGCRAGSHSCACSSPSAHGPVRIRVRQPRGLAEPSRPAARNTTAAAAPPRAGTLASVAAAARVCRRDRPATVGNLPLRDSIVPSRRILRRLGRESDVRMTGGW
jgi:hypothetical protein